MVIGEYVLVIFLSLFVIRHFRCTCAFIEMLKGCMAIESLGTPALMLSSQYSRIYTQNLTRVEKLN